jgi:hypothetical protein
MCVATADRSPSPHRPGAGQAGNSEVPPTAATPGAGGAHGEADEPDDQDGDGDPPKNLDGEYGTEEDQGERQNE